MQTLLVVIAAGLVGSEAVRQPGAASSSETTAWFQAAEQRLMGSIAHGDRTPWEELTDPEYVFTTEEGEVLTRQQLLAQLKPLPTGLVGDIAVKDLTVQEYADFAVVRFLADEWETVFGQRLTTKYRVTDTFRREGRVWKLVASHISVVTTDPPDQEVSSAGLPGFAGRYQLAPNGWIFTVELRDGKLHGGRDPKQLRPMIALAPNVFVVSGSLGEWIFVTDESGRATRIVNVRKFAPLIWKRIDS